MCKIKAILNLWMCIEDGTEVSHGVITIVDSIHPYKLCRPYNRVFVFVFMALALRERLHRGEREKHCDIRGTSAA